jgi:hypothetical protein
MMEFSAFLPLEASGKGTHVIPSIRKTHSSLPEATTMTPDSASATGIPEEYDRSSGTKSNDVAAISSMLSKKVF